MAEQKNQHDLDPGVKAYQQRQLEMLAELSRTQANAAKYGKIVIISIVIIGLTIISYMKTKDNKKHEPSPEGYGIITYESVLDSLKYLLIGLIVLGGFYILRKKNLEMEKEEEERIKTKKE